jgi:hypothetical protein
MTSNQLPADVARWIVAAVDEGWRPTIPDFGAVKTFRWNGYAFPEGAAALRLDHERVFVDVPLALPSPPPAGGDSDAMTVEFADGSTLESGDCYVSKRGTSIDNIAKTIQRRTGFTGLTWRWRATPEPARAVVWFATVRGRFRDLSNVEVRGKTATYGSGLWLEGAKHRYFLVDNHSRDSSDRTFDILIFAGESMSRTALGPDHRVLEFCLGSSLQIDRVIGIDDQKRVIEVHGARIGEEHRRAERTAPAVPLWPTVDSVRGNWVAPMFAKLSRALAAQPDLLFTPLAYYVSSIGRFIDNEFLDLQIALEAFASKLLEPAQGDELLAVKDKEAWKSWVEERRNEIFAHAVAGTEQSLLDRLKSLSRKATSNAVRDAFRRYGLELLREQKSVIGDRNVVAHTALMNTDGNYEFLREMRRISVVRSLLVALISLAIGYRGQIRGWSTPDRDDPEPASPEWWQVAPEDQRAAMDWFIAGAAA